MGVPEVYFNPPSLLVLLPLLLFPLPRRAIDVGRYSMYTRLISSAMDEKGRNRTGLFIRNSGP